MSEIDPNTAYICQNCQINLSKFGYPCLDLMIMACYNYSVNKLLAYSENHDSLLFQLRSVLRFLEEKGYIFTKEISTFDIAIYPNLKTSTKSQECFCWCFWEL
jgi:hypothetical protein